MSDIEHLAKEYMHTEDVQIKSGNTPPGNSSKFKKLVAALFGLILAFFLAEAGLRISGYNAAEQKKRTDIKTGLRVFAPDASVLNRQECLVNTVLTNNLGFHAKTYPQKKEPGTFRIVVVGDSFVEAVQVPVEKIFTSVLEDRLNARKDGRKYEVIPFGISGNASYANLQYLKAYGLEFEPDLIIDAFFSNDVLADYYRPDNPSAAAPYDENMNLTGTPAPQEQDLSVTAKNYLKSWLKKSNVILLVYSQYLNWRTVRNSRPAEEKPATTGLAIDSEIYLAEVPDFWKRAWKLQESIFAEFKKTSGENGAKFVLVSLPEAQRTHPDLGKEFLALVPAGVKLDLEMPDKQLSAIAKRQKIPFLAAQGFFTARAQRENIPTYWPCDGHFSGTGHAWMGEALYDFLNRQGLLQ